MHLFDVLPKGTAERGLCIERKGVVAGGAPFYIAMSDEMRGKYETFH